MKFERNETHDPAARSFVTSANVESANAAGCDFPIQNLPYGAFTNGEDGCARLCVAIGDQLLDLDAVAGRELLEGVDEVTLEACTEANLNELMGLGPARWTALRRALFHLLRADSVHKSELANCLHRQQDVTLVVPVAIGDYTDFYASLHHASNVGALFRPENPLLPNYKWVPIGYHGRASSIVASGVPVIRPSGQLKLPTAEQPVFAPTRRLDYETEMGAFVGVGNEMGAPIPLREAAGHIFGYCVVNDWSARDVQAWEYQPLGPFLAKSFATSLSPWVVTSEALVPYRVAAFERPAGDPRPLPYLDDAGDAAHGGLDLVVEVSLRTAAMRESGGAWHRLSRGNLRQMYWTFAQMLTHHASNGCPMSPGDLLGSGTISGPEPEARGCLLELTRGGAEPIILPDGTQRTFLEDGDEVRIAAWCQREGAARIGFGECRAQILPAR